ncbi:DUF1178 family protein [Afifella sp. H1R]|uniref:DUF1178 family protein n=1 Tax=Afifella sp. H1R TaxID=2908841 RepID=UPI001F442CF8|nr:DUF1178 family protein [Afifella sp. H1R]MCF1504237.1 DUF1178 family protein [Afifella sp. H1R]
MIHYDLRCDEGHGFDAWFASSKAFEEQQEAGLLSCPHCGSASVERALMAPAIAGGREREPVHAVAPEQGAADAPVAAGGGKGQQVATTVPAPLLEAMREVRKYVQAHADYVGNRFAEEARRIHYKESDPRGIYGEASREEIKELKDEGIEFQPLPVLPEDFN